MATVLLLLLVAATAVSAAVPVRYDNYRVYRVLPTQQDQLDQLNQVEETSDGFSFWHGPSKVHAPVDIMVPPHKLSEFTNLALSLGLPTELIVPDVQRKIDSQRPRISPREFGWTEYNNLATINAWLESLEQQYPSIVTPIVGGASYEGRHIKGVKVSYKLRNPGVFVEGGIHAREWISPATVTYILNQLLTSTDPAIRNIAENYDWYIFPSTNPDGYEYTHTTERLWRKTRSPNAGSTCIGTDPNRNWDFHWSDGGTSPDPCSNVYPGTAAFSEVEVRTLSQYITSVARNLLVYLSFHNSGQMFLTPYGHTDDPAPNNEQLVEITRNAAAAIKERHGTEYVYGSIAETIYIASGSSIDWVYDRLKVNISLAYELRDRGVHGFLLPPEQIIPTAEETLDSVISILNDASRLAPWPKCRRRNARKKSFQRRRNIYR